MQNEEREDSRTSSAGTCVGDASGREQHCVAHCGLAPVYVAVFKTQRRAARSAGWGTWTGEAADKRRTEQL
jgi:hypothetical protein